LWCPSYIGETLELLERENGLPLAGFTPPYGFEGTTQWLRELGQALGDETDILKRAELVRSEYQERSEAMRANLAGKRAFVSGGPGRLTGLLHVMADLGVEVVAAALFWRHATSRKNLSRVLKKFPNPPEVFMVSPSLYELDEVARNQRPDFWMGGYQEQHTCKRYAIPFIPITVYTASHQCFEGVIHVGKKIEMALEGFDFTANLFQSIEVIDAGSS
jgi:nitrogenase molybdenum-iron protein alpha/beta subunit